MNNMTKSEYIESMIIGENEYFKKVICHKLSVYPSHIIKLVVRHNIKIRPLFPYETYREVSAFLADNLSTAREDAHGLFSRKEDTIYLRSIDKVTIVHEFAHAIDLCLGKEKGYENYNSLKDDKIGYAFMRGEWINSYAGESLDEFFAESVRAYFDINISDCPFQAYKKDLIKKSPSMFKYIEDLMSAKKKVLTIA